MAENETKNETILTGIMPLNIQDNFERGLWKKVDM